MTTIIERQAIRAILLTPQHEVLLLRLRAPGTEEFFWITPGGGVEPGETPQDGLRRELREELGLELFQIGPLVWRRQHTFNWGARRICQREQYHIVEVGRFQPRMSDPVESQDLDRFQWWPASELITARERLTPLSLAHIVARYLSLGPPLEPLGIEVLID